MKKALILMLNLFLIFIFVSSSSAKSVDLETVIKVGRTHLQIQEQLGRSELFLAPKASLKGQGSPILKVRNLKEDEKILAYILDLDPEGYVAVSPDTDIRPVIAYSSKGKFSLEDTSDNVLLHLLKWDMENRLEAIPITSEKLKKDNNALWEKYLTQRESPSRQFLAPQLSFQQWGPWLKTTWHQEGPYNKYCPCLHQPTLDLCIRKAVVGCAATAMAQIINYWGKKTGYPRFVQFSGEDRYETETQKIRIDEDADARDFPDFNELNNLLSDIKYDGNKDEIAALCFACGISVKMDYRAEWWILDPESSGYNSKAYVNKFNYASAEKKMGDEADFYAVLEQNMKDGQPAHLSIKEGKDAPTSHSIVADGFKSNGEEHFYHLNFGWGSSSPNSIDECWYSLPAGMPSSYNFVMRGVVNIYPGTTCFFADLDCDGDVDSDDVRLTAVHWDTLVGDALYDSRYDFNNDSKINLLDVRKVAQYWGQTAPFSPAAPCIVQANSNPRAAIVYLQLSSSELKVGETATVTLLAECADEIQGMELHLSYDSKKLQPARVILGEHFLKQPNNLTPAITLGPKINQKQGTITFGAVLLGKQGEFSKTSKVLSTIKVTAQQEGESELMLKDITLIGANSNPISVVRTQTLKINITTPVPYIFALGQNYPNPFNPETWIPYQLAQDHEVTIRIYNIKGKLVRSLYLGYKQAAFYTRKEQAAYWDGQNNMGEKVASGVYFYTLQAGDFRATRRMLIVK